MEYPELPLKVLYFSPNSMPGGAKEAIAQRRYDLVSAVTATEALQLLLKYSFDAAVIENGDEDLEVTDFTIEVNRIKANRPIFLTSDWDLSSQCLERTLLPAQSQSLFAKHRVN